MSHELANEYIDNIGKDNITAAHLQEWYDKLSTETDTLKKKFIQNHITLISNIIHSREQ